MNTHSSIRKFAALYILLWLTFGLRLAGIGRESLWRDEVDSIRFAAEIWATLAESETLPAAMGELAGYLTRPGWNGPLYFLAMEPWLQLAGRSELALRFPSALAGLTVVALSYVLGARLLGTTAGRLAALLTAVNPYLVWYSGEGKMYTIITALALLSTYLLLRACAGGQRRFWMSYILVTTLIFYTHILTPLLAPVQMGLVLALHPRAVRSPAAWLSAGALTLPYLPLLLWQWPHLAQPAETGFAFVPWHTMARRLGEVFSRGIIGWPAAIPLVLLLGAMAMGMILAKKRVAWGLLWWAGAPLVGLYLVSLRRPLFTERYLIWTLPAWLMLAAGGLAALAQRKKVGRWVAVGWTAGLVAAGLVGIGYQWNTPVRADFRSAAAFVSSHHQAGELILFQIPYLQATFDYYAPELEYRVAEGPYTNWDNPPAEVDDHLHRTTAGYRRVWLILSEAPMWDARGLTVDWFQTHGRLLEQVTLNRVQVTKWELDPGHKSQTTLPVHSLEAQRPRLDFPRLQRRLETSTSALYGVI